MWSTEEIFNDKINVKCSRSGFGWHVDSVIMEIMMLAVLSHIYRYFFLCHSVGDLLTYVPLLCKCKVQILLLCTRLHSGVSGTAKLVVLKLHRSWYCLPCM